jgi:hypothetical protein
MHKSVPEAIKNQLLYGHLYKSAGYMPKIAPGINNAQHIMQGIIGAGGGIFGAEMVARGLLKSKLIEETSLPYMLLLASGALSGGVAGLRSSIKKPLI